MVLHDLTGFQRDLLRVVEKFEEEPHGLAVKERIEELYDGAEIHHGRLYPNLDTPCQKGLVEKGQKDRRTNWYRVTERGQRELQRYVDWHTGREQSEQSV